MADSKYTCRHIFPSWTCITASCLGPGTQGDAAIARIRVPTHLFPDAVRDQSFLRSVSLPFPHWNERVDERTCERARSFELLRVQEAAGETVQASETRPLSQTSQVQSACSRRPSGPNVPLNTWREAPARSEGDEATGTVVDL